MLIAIGKKIKLQRITLELSREQVAKGLNVSVDTISKIELGKRVGTTFVRYIVYLNSKGANLKAIFNNEK